MYCSNCGTQMADDAKFCPSCGHPADAAAKARPATNPAPEQPAAAPAAGKPKMALWKKIGLGLVAFIVAVVAISMWATSDLSGPVEAQLEALRAGDIDGAYVPTSKAFRDAISKEQFAEFVKSRPSMTKIADYSFSSREVSGATGKLTGTLTTTDGGVLPIEYMLVKENDEWKILGFTLNPDSSE